MSKKRIIEHDTDLTLRSDDYILKDSATNDTKKITPEAFVEGALDNYLAGYVSGLDSASASSDSDIFYTVVDGVQKKVSKSTILSADRTARTTAEGTIVANFAAPYDSTASYAVGDYCIKDLVLYKCTSATSGTWDSSKWTQVTALDLTSGVASDLADEIEARQSADETLQGEIDELPVDVQVDGGTLVNEDNIAVLDSLVAYGEASGEIATFSDGSDLAMKSLKVAIEPVQEGSGDTSPTNIRPISGWDECNVSVVGKNLVEDVIENANIGNTGVIVQSSSQPYDLHIVEVKKNVTYTITSDEDSFVGGYFISKPVNGSTTYDGQRVVSNKTFIATIDGWIVFRTSHEYATPQCEVGNQASSYVPYNSNSQTYTIDLDGTRYGGEVDVVSGVLTVDRAIANMGDLTWNYYDDYFYSSVSGKAIGNYNIMSSQYKVTSETSATAMHDGEIKGHASNTNLYVKDSRYTNKDTFKTAMNGVQLVYELATPTTIQLTPTQVKSLLGVNNVWADCGDVDVSYVRDLTTTINYILEQLEG